MTAAQLPTLTFDAFKAALFNNHEHVGLKRTVWEHTDAIEEAEFTCINPLRDLLGKFSIDNLSALRNFLVEFDNGWSLTRQAQYFEETLRLPFTTKVFSGSRSLHYIIGLTEGVDEDTYRSLANFIGAIVRHCDETSKNPNRLSRTPNVLRRDTGCVQSLLEVRGRITKEALLQSLQRAAPVDFEREARRQAEIKARLAQRVEQAQEERPALEVLAPVFRRFLEGRDTVEDRARYSSRHELLNRAAAQLFMEGAELGSIESTLHELADVIGIGERRDAEKLFKYYLKKGF